ncbi:Snapin/Pallidin-domain-containing protein [Radiomyces spectabilis]|uniref:Snapin/Pallidin-domain-containing protein n=1 Tax=Radiomyces spectabilis TaxID=64574 RepID=UPI00221FA98E|nr:Snapin/Pallidin-domain-containing protein [Radiomyces spectabilis]KAI8374542.1 Snapin/Pallidin-domain-containing protein [Radiomyces spectabilis]
MYWIDKEALERKREEKKNNFFKMRPVLTSLAFYTPQDYRNFPSRRILTHFFFLQQFDEMSSPTERSAETAELSSTAQEVLKKQIVDAEHSEEMATEGTSKAQSDDASTSIQEQDSANKMSNGIVGLLKPLVLDMDKAIVATQKSQEELSKEIERLIAELELFADIAEPPKLHPALEKLGDARKRLTSANQLMQETQARVQRIQAQLATRSSSNQISSSTT